jgi:hypothetical protein
VHRPVAAALALLLAVVVATPAEAVTVHRVFAAGVGTNSANGSIRIAAHTDGTGRVDYALKGLRTGQTYRVEVRKGRCNNLGTVITRLSGVTASSTGRVVKARSIASSTMYSIWKANWSSLLAVRIVSGTHIRCGNLNFVRATRVRVAKQGVLNAAIDLAVVRAPSGYPYCNVAMYMGALNQPTEPAPGATFISAHARTGMFLPLLDVYRAGRSSSLIGKLVYVWTSNNRLHTYRIYAVKKTDSVQAAVGETPDRLWLQTSTGPNYTYPKLVVKAQRISSAPSSYDAAHPSYRIVKCG